MTAMGCSESQFASSTNIVPKAQTHVANSDILLTRALQELSQNTILLELEVHLGLVGLDLDEDITGSEGVTGVLLPCADVARGHGGREGGHGDDGVSRVGCGILVRFMSLQ
jgi:hypothetical protein